MQCPVQKRLARRMGTEEVGGLTLPQLQQIWCPQGDAPVRRLWGGQQASRGGRTEAQDPA